MHDAGHDTVPLLVLGACIVVVATGWGLFERDHEYREVFRSGRGEIIEAIEGFLVIILFALDAAMFGFYGWKLGILAVLASFGIGAGVRHRSIFETLDVREAWARRRDSRAIKRAMRDSRIVGMLCERSLTKGDLETLLREFRGSVPTNDARRGICDPEIVAWCLNRRVFRDRDRSLNELIILSEWLRTGAAPRER